MSKEIKIAGSISFGDKRLNVYIWGSGRSAVQGKRY